MTPLACAALAACATPTTAAGPSAVSSTAATRAALAAPATATTTSTVSTASTVSTGLPALGPTPSSWQGGHAVPVAPRWWPLGYGHPSVPWPSAWPRPVAFSPTARGVLSGMVVALDPGHDIGNGSHVAELNHRSWVGLWKICNTTGTATDAGYPESTFAFDVAARLRRLLTAAGATVVLTRDSNVRSTYGPCVGARGAFPAQEHARLMVSLHGDGGPSSGRGFHVIVPGYYKGYTDDIVRGSLVLGKDLIAAMSRSFHPTTYLASPLSIRKDQGTLNMSNVPTAIVETLNMRNRYDAAIAMSATGRERIAEALYAGIVRYLRG